MDIVARFDAVRGKTLQLCGPLSADDCMVQSMPDVSPTKWHLAHTSWFFEQFVFPVLQRDYRPFHPIFQYLFNSYYESVGSFLEKERRGTLSRPTLEEVQEYRKYVDAFFNEAWSKANDDLRQQALSLATLGLHHEQQHQELLQADIKHVFWSNPLRPAYMPLKSLQHSAEKSSEQWLDFDAGTHLVGHAGDDFCFDNERPRHETLIPKFRIRSRTTTNAEYLEFIRNGGYRRSELWLSDGWAAARKNAWTAPLYWEENGTQWRTMTFSGMQPVREAEPVVHLSFYEADAFARWRGYRLPTEFEWEVAASSSPFLWGEAWEWTRSAYQPYPGYQPPDGALGEYNGKFMCNQIVLRGASCATPQSHSRSSYRNFFSPATRWQFSGVRLAA